MQYEFKQLIRLLLVKKSTLYFDFAATLAKEIELNLNVFGRSNLQTLEEETSEENGILLICHSTQFFVSTCSSNL